jgi:hypothetical protein
MWAGIAIFMCAVPVLVALYKRVAKKIRRDKAIDARDLGLSMYRLRKDKKHWTNRMRAPVKIVASFYQVTTQYGTILVVRFPAVFTNFTRAFSSIFNLDFLNIFSVGCVVEMDYHTRLVIQTLLPLIIYVCIFIYYKIRSLSAAQEKKARMRDNCLTLALAISYLVFASVSTTIFQAFGAHQFGDDKTYWLTVDPSVDYYSDSHTGTLLYAQVMILVYPVGTTAIYAALLFRSRAKLTSDRRDDDVSIKKISFLWDNYETDFWWFEIFECTRRLASTGMLVFAKQGSLSQVLLAIVMSIVSVAVYSQLKPFESPDDDTLAVLAQWSIFATLFGALISKAKIDEIEDYDENVIGAILILANVSVICLASARFLVKPLAALSKIISKKHVHNCRIKGLTENEKKWPAFFEYFEAVAASTAQEAGWETMSRADWGVSDAWLSENKVVGDWRCSTGNGPVDQCRVTLEVDADMDAVLDWLESPTDKLGQFLEYSELKTHSDGRGKDIYMASKVGFPMLSRDVVLRQKTRKGKKGTATILSRSIATSNKVLKRGAQLHRVRAVVKMAGHSLEALGERTRVCYVLDGNLKGLFTLDALNKKAGVMQMKRFVDGIRTMNDFRNSRTSSLFGSDFGSFDGLPEERAEDADEEFEVAVNPMNKGAHKTRLKKGVTGENVGLEIEMMSGVPVHAVKAQVFKEKTGGGSLSK